MDLNDSDIWVQEKGLYLDERGSKTPRRATISFVSPFEYIQSEVRNLVRKVKHYGAFRRKAFVWESKVYRSKDKSATSCEPTRNQLAIVDKTLSEVVDVDLAILNAAESGDLAKLKILSSQGASFVRYEPPWQRIPLHVAIRYGQEDVVRYLLGMGVPVASYRLETQPLHLASVFGHLQMTSLLLEAGAPPDRRDSFENFPLHYACQNQHIEVVRLLLAVGASPTCANREGDQPLHYTCLNGSSLVARMLLDAGASPGCANLGGNQPLHDACQGGFVELARILLDAGAPLDCADHNGNQPLHHACRVDHLDIVRILLDAGASPRCENSNAEEPLHLASKAASWRVIQTLVSAGASCSSLDLNGSNVLHYLAQRSLGPGWIPMYRELILAGADPFVLNKDGLTALNLAAKCYNFSFVELFKELKMVHVSAAD